MCGFLWGMFRGSEPIRSGVATPRSNSIYAALFRNEFFQPTQPVGAMHYAGVRPNTDI
jgi:hypothetical protein